MEREFRVIVWIVALVLAACSSPESRREASTVECRDIYGQIGAAAPAETPNTASKPKARKTSR